MANNANMRAFQRATTVDAVKAAMPGVVQTVSEVMSSFTPERRAVVLAQLGITPPPQLEIRVPVAATGVRKYPVREGQEPDALITALKRMEGGVHWDYVLTGDKTFEVGEYEVVDVTAKLADTITVHPDASTDDVATYKRLVRKVAIAEARDLGWCDSGLNEYLGYLGLPEKTPQVVPVTVMVERTVMVTVDDADDRDAARAALAERPDDYREVVSRHVGTGTLREFAVKAPGDATHPIVGEIDELYTPTYDLRSGKSSYYNGYTDTRNTTNAPALTLRDGEPVYVAAGSDGEIVALFTDGQNRYCEMTVHGEGIERLQAQVDARSRNI